MAYGKLIDLKRDGKGMAIGAALMFALCVLPIVSKPVGDIIASVRDMLDGNK